MKAKYIVRHIREIPDEFTYDLLNFIEELRHRTCIREKRNKNKRFSFDWEGGLSELTDQYTSVELQHKAIEWR